MSLRRVRLAIEYGRGMLRGHRRVRFGPGVKLSGPGNYDLRPGACVRKDARVWVGPNATLTMEKGSAIGARAVVNVESGLIIGARSQVSWDSQVLDTDFHSVTDAEGVVRQHTSAIEIGEHVLIGTGAMVLKGVRIGDGAVVAAGSVVTKDVAAGVVVAGNPARPIGKASNWV